MALPSTQVQNQSFAIVRFSGAVAPEFDSPVLLTCLDNQGNTIKRTIVELDSALGDLTIMLPSIESLANDLNCEISFIVTSGTNDININRYDNGVDPATDVIGQSSNLVIVAATYTAGAVITFTPTYDGYWSYSVTQN